MRQTLKNCKRIVIKVGTATITYPNGRLNLKRIEELAWVLTDLRNRGMDVALVTSGAIGVGAVRMSMPSRPTVTREKQAAAAVGQAMLMQIYHNFFDRYNQTVAQILLTKEEMGTEERYTNTHNTFETLFEMGIIPIVNANDTISTYEIEFSDNDRLSAMVAEVTGADLLVLLTDIDALYDKNPREHADAKKISYVEKSKRRKSKKMAMRKKALPSSVFPYFSLVLAVSAPSFFLSVSSCGPFPEPCR